MNAHFLIFKSSGAKANDSDVFAFIESLSNAEHDYISCIIGDFVKPLKQPLKYQ